MTTYNFSSLANNANLAFTTADTLSFGNQDTFAFALRFSAVNAGGTSAPDLNIFIADGPETGKQVTLLDFDLRRIRPLNFSFEAGGKVLVDESTLWPQGKFVTTNLIAATGFLKDNPKTVQSLLQGELDAIDFIKANPGPSQKFVATGIFNGTGQKVDEATIAAVGGEVEPAISGGICCSTIEAWRPVLPALSAWSPLAHEATRGGLSRLPPPSRR